MVLTNRSVLIEAVFREQQQIYADGGEGCVTWCRRESVMWQLPHPGPD